MTIFKRPIAHRGLHDKDSSENSMSAFKKAIEKGYNIETDVHLLKDGKVAIFHDSTINRMLPGRSGKISHLTSEDLAGGNYLLPNGEHIPLLEDLIKLVDGKVDILCELKSISGFSYKLERAVYKLIKDKPWIKVQAFNPLSVLWFKHHAPKVVRGQLATETNSKMLQLLFFFFGPFRMLKHTKPHFFSYNVLNIPSERLQKAAKKYKMELLAWTVKDKEQANLCKENNIDNIIFENFDPIHYDKNDNKKDEPKDESLA